MPKSEELSFSQKETIPVILARNKKALIQKGETKPVLKEKSFLEDKGAFLFCFGKGKFPFLKKQ